MFVPFPFSSLTLSFSSVTSTHALVSSFPLLSLLVFFVSFWFHCFPPISSFVFSCFPFLIEKMIAFTLHGSSGPGGLRRLFFLPKRAVSSRGDFTKFLRCRERRHQPQPALPGRKPMSVKRGDPSHLSNINIGSTAESGRSIFNESSYLLVHNKKTEAK